MASSLDQDLLSSAEELSRNKEIEHIKPDVNMLHNEEFQVALDINTIKQEIMEDYSFVSSCVKQDVEVKDEVVDHLDYFKNVLDSNQHFLSHDNCQQVTTTEQGKVNSVDDIRISSYCSIPQRGRPRKLNPTQPNEKSFGCTLCDYKCARKTYLYDHMRTHTGAKPFSCSYCHYRCATNSHLTRHLKTHTEDKPYACNLCDFKTTWKECLNNHVKRHAGLKSHCCPFCTYKSVQKSNLARHLKSHAAEKSYDCSYCDFKCFHKSKFSNHMKTHKSEVPPICELYIKEEFDVETN